MNEFGFYFSYIASANSLLNQHVEKSNDSNSSKKSVTKEAKSMLRTLNYP